MSISQMVSPGLQATYFNDDAFTAQVSSVAVPTIDFSSSTGEVPAASLTAGTSYSIRWSGFVRPQYAQEYTFYAGVVSAEERVRLWVDNSLLVEQWTSLAGTEGSGVGAVGVLRGCGRSACGAACCG